MTLRIASLLIHRVAVMGGTGAIALGQPAGELGESRQPLGTSGRPPAVEEDDVPRRPRGEVSHQLRAQGPDRRGSLVVEEVKVVQEARGLPDVHPEQRVQASVGGVQHLDGILRSQSLELARQVPYYEFLVANPARVRGLGPS